MSFANNVEPGKLVIISGPSGVGKSTVVRQLIETCELPLELSVSATTRPMRPGEVDGVNYVFLTDEQFQSHVSNDQFLEFVEVFGRGQWYGTLRGPVMRGIADGKWIILEIDVEGASKVRKVHPEAITIFIHPGSIEELERRLRSRGTETEEAIQRRLEVSSGEMSVSDTYQHVFINDNVDQCVAEISQTLVAQKNKRRSGENPECTKN